MNRRSLQTTLLAGPNQTWICAGGGTWQHGPTTTIHSTKSDQQQLRFAHYFAQLWRNGEKEKYAKKSELSPAVASFCKKRVENHWSGGRAQRPLAAVGGNPSLRRTHSSQKQCKILPFLFRACSENMFFVSFLELVPKTMLFCFILKRSFPKQFKSLRFILRAHSQNNALPFHFPTGCSDTWLF